MVIIPVVVFFHMRISNPKSFLITHFIIIILTFCYSQKESALFLQIPSGNSNL